MSLVHQSTVRLPLGTLKMNALTEEEEQVPMHRDHVVADTDDSTVPGAILDHPKQGY